VFRQILQWPLCFDTEGVSVPLARLRDMAAIVETVHAPGTCTGDGLGSMYALAPLCSTRGVVEVIG
jgi:hypothetical protein